MIINIGDEVLLNTGMAVLGVREGTVTSVDGEDIYINVILPLRGVVNAHRYPCEFVVTKKAKPYRGPSKVSTGMATKLLGWLKDNNLTICEFNDQGYSPTRQPIETILAEFERAILRERIMAGLARSTKKPGRPPIDPEKAEKIRRELTRGTSINATAKKFKCGVGTVHRIKVKTA